MNCKDQSTNRKGQVTIFVIIGIVLLFIVVIAVVVIRETQQNKPPLKSPAVSEQARPVQNHVEACLGELIKEGLTKAGMNGGYITNNFRQSPIPYESEVLLFPPQSIPYWYYLDSSCQNPSGCLSSNKPFLCKTVDCPLRDESGPGSLQEQLEQFISENIKDRCLDLQFETVDVTELAQPSTQVFISQSGVSAILTYPLHITSRSTQQEETIPYFLSSQDVDLVNIFKLSKEIYAAQKDYNLFDRVILDLLAIYSGIDADLLPPTSQVQLFTAGRTVWVLNAVKDKLMYDVLPYLNIVQFINTEGYRPLAIIDDSNYGIYNEGIYKSLEFKTSNAYYDLSAKVTYPFSDIYLRIRTGDDESQLIQPQQMDTGDNLPMRLMGFFLNDYRFKYDMTVPLLITIQDKNAFKGAGYSFSFAMQSIIRNNVPLTINQTTFTQRMPSGMDTASDVQRPERIITVKTLDKYTRQQLSGVAISYSCGPEFIIGETEFDGKDAVLAQKFPFCQFGGAILARKQGYLSTGIAFNNREGRDPASSTLELWPIAEKDVSVLKRTPQNVMAILTHGPGAIALYGTEATNLSANDTVMLTMHRIKESEYEDDIPLTAVLLFKGNESAVLMPPNLDFGLEQEIINQSTYDEYVQNVQATTTQSLEKTELVPGRYELTAYLLWSGNPPLAIPEKTKTICAGLDAGICIGSTKTITYPAQNFSTWLSGGALVNFTLNQGDVYGNYSLDVYVLEMPLPHNWDELERYKALEDYQKGKQHLVRPRLI
ncbi:MAG: hypothetical protein V1725_05355 [archaeon]